MGFIDRLRRKDPAAARGAVPTPSRTAPTNDLRAASADRSGQTPPSEFGADALDAAWRCMRTSKDVESFTRGRGSATIIAVAGTQHRTETIMNIASRYPATPNGDDPGGVAAAIVMRDPTNEHDRNAIRVLIDGIHVGFLPKGDAKEWQPVLVECERRGLTLVGMVKFVGAQRWGLRLQLRDNLPGYSGPITTAIRERAELLSGDGDPVRLTNESFSRVASVIDVDERAVPTTKRSAGLVAKRVRDAVGEIYLHAAALKVCGAGSEVQRILDLAEEMDDLCDYLLEAADEDEREDAVQQLSDQGTKLTAIVRATMTS